MVHLKKYILPSVLVILAAVMTACGNSSSTINNELTNLTSEDENTLTDQLQEMIHQESDLQSQFETFLSEDGSTEVFNNLDTREEQLSTIQSTSEDYQSAHDSLSDVNYEENEDVDNDTYETMLSHLNDLNETLSNYTSKYEETLESTRTYFESLEDESTDFEQFEAGLHEVNDHHDQINEYYNQLNDQITNFENSKQEVLNQLDSNNDSAQATEGAITAPSSKILSHQSVTDFQYEINPNNFSIVPLEDQDPSVALLTIDDAPDQHALEMANILKELDASAIFFVNGMYLSDEKAREDLKAIYDMGFEIGNHTTTHPYLTNLNYEQTVDEIVTTNDLVEEITGERPRFFRAPFGINTAASLEVVQDEQMTQMNWTYGYDWEAQYQDASALANIMVNTEMLSDGANLLMHDRSWTKEALPNIVQGLRDKGYTILNPAQIQDDFSEVEN